MQPFLPSESRAGRAGWWHNRHRRIWRADQRVRLRDRQTLVLTGVIRETDFAQVTKWPILGDLPILGQLFRQSISGKDKQELVILVTPSIVDDESGGAYGYGYRPSTREARQLMGPR